MLCEICGQARPVTECSGVSLCDECKSLYYSDEIAAKIAEVNETFE
jgi:hypothetical protein